ncbi:MAG: hypothetical protein H7X99_10350 [Saprospiraceae bacterium]|nr:hypothetical protein [Saprospiraceae bacterium]
MKNSYIICLVLVIILLNQACYTRKEGCQEVLAENYDVTSDDPCDDCCIFPKLQLQITHMAGDSTFSTTDTLVNDMQQKYRILDIRYYLSSFVLHNTKTGNNQIIETISNADKTITLPDDMKIVRYTDPLITAGSIKDAGTFDQLSFTLGLKDTILNTVFANLTEGHVLSELNKLKNTAGDQAHISIKIERLITTPDTLNFNLTGYGTSVNFTIDSTLTTPKGINTVFSVKTDYAMLFKNINFNLSSDSIEMSLKQNFKKILIVK